MGLKGEVTYQPYIGNLPILPKQLVSDLRYSEDGYLDLMASIMSYYTGSLISSLGHNSYAEYSAIFGSVVYDIGWPIRDQGETPLLNRKLKLKIPNQTRTLRDCVSGFIIG